MAQYSNIVFDLITELSYREYILYKKYNSARKIRDISFCRKISFFVLCNVLGNRWSKNNYIYWFLSISWDRARSITRERPLFLPHRTARCVIYLRNEYFYLRIDDKKRNALRSDKCFMFSDVTTARKRRRLHLSFIEFLETPVHCIKE